MNSKYYYIIGAVVIVAIGLALFMFFNTTDSAMKKFAAGGLVSVDQNTNVTTSPAAPTQPAQYCPEPGTLIRKDVKWITPDHKWENYTPSMATKVLNFIGAQWVGIKIGKIICLYQTNEAVSFPVALEQTSSIMALEPKNAAWSGLVENRKFCKSASVADCPYYHEAPKDVSNVYKEIQYAPDKNATV